MIFKIIKIIIKGCFTFNSLFCDLWRYLLKVLFHIFMTKLLLILMYVILFFISHWVLLVIEFLTPSIVLRINIFINLNLIILLIGWSWINILWKIIFVHIVIYRCFIFHVFHFIYLVLQNLIFLHRLFASQLLSH